MKSIKRVTDGVGETFVSNTLKFTNYKGSMLLSRKKRRLMCVAYCATCDKTLEYSTAFSYFEKGQ